MESRVKKSANFPKIGSELNCFTRSCPLCLRRSYSSSRSRSWNKYSIWFRIFEVFAFFDYKFLIFKVRFINLLSYDSSWFILSNDTKISIICLFIAKLWPKNQLFTNQYIMKILLLFDRVDPPELSNDIKFIFLTLNIGKLYLKKKVQISQNREVNWSFTRSCPLCLRRSSSSNFSNSRLTAVQLPCSS